MSFYVGTILRFPQQRFSAAQEKKTKEKGEKEEKFRNVVETILRLCCFLFFILFFLYSKQHCQISACDPGDWHDIGAHQFFVATNSTFHFARNQQETKTLKTLPPCNEKKINQKFDCKLEKPKLRELYGRGVDIFL